MTRRLVIISVVLLAFIPLAYKAFFRFLNYVEIDIVSEGDVPPSPVLSPEDALEAMQVQPGFKVETVASEPHVFNPVAISFDARTRIWVCEFVTFMPNVEAEGEDFAGNSIAILEDQNSDGQIDKRTVFLEGLKLPRAIAMVPRGILYADDTQLYFAEVMEDDSVGLHEVVDSTYANGGNVEYKANGLLYGLDGWYYSAFSPWKYKIVPLDTAAVSNAQEIYANKYWKALRAPTETRGQWGIAMDDFGRLFYNGNSSPPKGEFLRADLLPVEIMQEIERLAFDVGERYVYPARINPGVNRGYLGRDTLIRSGQDKGKLKKFTSAGGTVIYRGDKLPADYYGMAVTTEPAGNLISARRVIEEGQHLSGEELFQESEILASHDERFRPVNLKTAPDGSLYVIDMYHGIIQHSTFMTDYLKRQIASRGLSEGNSSTGRIYRLISSEATVGKTGDLHEASLSELVEALSHPNGWWRDTARRLLVQGRMVEAIPSVRALVGTSSDARIRINALWTLHGLSGVDMATVELALKSAEASVRSTAIAVSGTVPESMHANLAELLLAHASDDYEVALEVAVSVSRNTKASSLSALEKVLEVHQGKRYVDDAVVAGAAGREKDFQKRLDPKKYDGLIVRLEEAAHSALSIESTQALEEDYLAGRALYLGDGACSGCHGPEGKGIRDLGPPLASSEWVTGASDRLAKILLFGLEGEIVVNGIAYDGAMEMPGTIGGTELNDAQLAELASYIRNAWGNQAPRVTADEFREMRAKYSGRIGAFQAYELMD